MSANESNNNTKLELDDDPFDDYAVNENIIEPLIIEIHKDEDIANDQDNNPVEVS